MTSENKSPSGAFRRYLPDLSTPRFTTMCRQNAREYARDFLTKHHPPWLYELYLHWRELFREPFRGVTSDGSSNLFFLISVLFDFDVGVLQHSLLLMIAIDDILTYYLL